MMRLAAMAFALALAQNARAAHIPRRPAPRSSPGAASTRRATLGGVGLAALAVACPCCRPPAAGARENVEFARWMARLEEPFEAKLRPRKMALLTGLDAIPARSGERRVICELGVGTGPNLQLMSPSVRRDSRIIGIDPNVAMLPYAAEAAKAAGIGANFELREGTGEALPLDTASADAVVCTHVLCSVASQEKVLSEIRRVLVPGGRYFFLEHVLSESDRFLAMQQRALDPLQQALADGCHVTRRTRAAIESAGFARVDSDDFYVNGAWLVGPHIAGFAIR
ncbi:S-adenosyl-L-methionine-dependent methyltransferase [Pavlovales sp. CCMP2436]|nr:S-adenosyl-L-methionine-dependent methyltransferase [Pavlovales sp. CCMP2436]